MHIWLVVYFRLWWYSRSFTGLVGLVKLDAAIPWTTTTIMYKQLLTVIQTVYNYKYYNKWKQSSVNLSLVKHCWGAMLYQSGNIALANVVLLFHIWVVNDLHDHEKIFFKTCSITWVCWPLHVYLCIFMSKLTLLHDLGRKLSWLLHRVLGRLGYSAEIRMRFLGYGNTEILNRFTK